MINNWPFYSEEEKDLVLQILSSGEVSSLSGKYGKKFEKEFSSFCGSNYALRIANGTLALLAAYKSIKLGKGDEIITTPRSFIATVTSAMELGANPVFADVDLDSGAITAETIEPLITKKTKAICVVHLGGWPADMLRIKILAKKYNLFLIEDCSQAHGAKIDNKSVGMFSDIAVWSFATDKIISTGGEGGMITTNDKKLKNIISSYRNHGKNQKKLNIFVKDNYLYKWVHDSVGINLRLTEIQSAIGLIQLRKIKTWNYLRNKNANIFIEMLSEITSVRIPKVPENFVHAWYKFYLYINKEKLLPAWSRDRIIKEINLLGYPAFQGSCSELYLEDCFKTKNNISKKRLKNARKLGETSIMLLIHPTISLIQMENYALVVKSVILKATR